MSRFAVYEVCSRVGIARRFRAGVVGGFSVTRDDYTREEAQAIVDWLTERAAGYPPSRELVENPRF